MAQRLGDVLHLFLGEEPAQTARADAPAPVAVAPAIGCLCPSAEILPLAVAFNLAAAHALRSGATRFVASPATLCVGSPEGAQGLRSIEASREQLAGVLRDGSGVTHWLQLDPARLGNPKAEGGNHASVPPTWLDDSVHVIAPGTEALTCSLRAMRRARELAPRGRLWVVALADSPLGGATARAERAAALLADRLGGDVTLAGVLRDEAALYRSWVRRRPLCRADAEPGSRDSVALVEAARRIVSGAAGRSTIGAT